MAKYSFSQLESLWKKAGGNPIYAAMAAAVAMAESGGNSSATNKNSNGTTDRGLWQVNSVHGSLSTTDPTGNARSAVQISKNGTDWRPWCTAWSSGKCSGTFLGSGSPFQKFLPAGSPTGKTTSGSSPSALTPAAKAIAAAKTELGLPYKFGAEAPGKNFDCSGLTQWAYSKAGINIPRTAAAQQTATSPVSKSDAKPGDLVFFGKPAHHVALYLGGGLMLEAPHTGAVIKVTNVGNATGYGRVNGSGAANTATSGANVTPAFDPLNPLAGLGDLSKAFDPANWWKVAIQPFLMKALYLGEIAVGAGVMLAGVMLIVRQSNTYKQAENAATAVATKGAVTNPRGGNTAAKVQRVRQSQPQPSAPKGELSEGQQAQLAEAGRQRRNQATADRREGARKQRFEANAYGKHSQESAAKRRAVR